MDPALGQGAMGFRCGQAELRRCPAHLIEGEQPGVAIETGILETLGHDRRRELLEAHGGIGRGP